MGYILISIGLKFDLVKVEVIINMLKFKDIEGVQCFNGFINYLVKFFLKFLEVMELICCLIWKDI